MDAVSSEVVYGGLSSQDDCLF